MPMSRQSVIVELATEPRIRPNASKRERVAELQRAADAARGSFEGFLTSMREFDPGLTVQAKDTFFPVIVITADEAAIQHLRDNHPTVVTAVKKADGLSIPETDD
jgi:hypothetical protein